MNKEFIKDFYGRIIGSIETNGTKTIGRDFYGRIIATYDSRDNYTRDFYGKILSRGNTVAGILMMKK